MNDLSANSKLDLSTTRQSELLKSLADLIKQRADAEVEIEADFKQRVDDCNSKHSLAYRQLSEEHEEEIEQLNSKYLSRLETARLSFEANSQRANQEREESLEVVQSRHMNAMESADFSVRQAYELAEANFDQDTQLAESVAAQARTTTANTAEQFAWLEDQGQRLLKRRGTRFQPPATSALGKDAAAATLLAEYGESAKAAHEKIQTLSRWGSVKYCDEGWPVIVFFVVLGISSVATGLTLGWSQWQWAAISLGLAAAVSIGSWQILEVIVRRKATGLIGDIQRTLGMASLKLTNAQSMVDIEHKERLRQLQARRDKQESQAAEAYETAKRELDAKLQAETTAINQANLSKLNSLQHTWDQDAEGLRKKFPPLIEQKKEAFDLLVKRMTDERDIVLEKHAKEYNDRWDKLIASWQQGIRSTFAEVDRMNEFCQATFPDWDSVDWQAWEPENRRLPALQFGKFAVDLIGFEGGLSDVDLLRVERETLQLPAVLAFPQSPSLLIEAELEGRDAAVRVIQNTMLRLLTSLPAGKVRFTIIDPTGLGQNFSAFMHLADFDDRLVANRIWTEAQHINQRLADLTEHMENVIQKYLRNEFESIQEYNEKAGEVAEPFQILVVANFPANFSEEAARRLVSIASSGARCGVYTLISADTQMKLPRNFDLADLEANANTLAWYDGRLQWKRPELTRLPIELESPPHDDLRDRDHLCRRSNRPRTRIASKSLLPRCRPHRMNGGLTIAAMRSRCRWDGPAPPSCSTCSWARALRSTC